MLTRANIALCAALFPGLVAYVDLFDNEAPAAKLAFFVLIAFSAVSFLLSLFEDESESKGSRAQLPIFPRIASEYR